MKFYSIDFETHYDEQTYTLKKMSTDEYVMDPRFEVLCLSVYAPDFQLILQQDEIDDWLDTIDPAEVGFIAQHAHFDALIFSNEYDFAPGFWVDTLSMSRAVSGVGVRHNLDAQCRRYGLPPKTVEYDKFSGVLWKDMSPERRKKLGAQCLGDSHRTYIIAQRMLPHVPDEELRIIDMNVRMFSEPFLVGDINKLQNLLISERQHKKELLAKYDLTEKDFASDDKFEALLLSEGQEVIYKEAKNKRGYKGAFAKSDPFMQELLSSPDETIAELAKIRLEVKSTIQQSRAERLLAKAKRGRLPVYYNYYGARNGRFSGGNDDNFQNLPSRGKNGKALRESIQAPDGWTLVVADESQIECRMEMAFAGQFDKLEAFRANLDLYCELGTKLYGRVITKEDVLERQLSKTILLQSGYGSGWLKVKLTALRLFGLDLSDEEAKRFLNVYRADNPAICGYPAGRRRAGGLWQRGEEWLQALSEGWRLEYFAPVEKGQPYSDEPLFRVANHKVILPNGLKLHYDGLRWGTHQSPKGDIREGWLLPRLDGLEFFYGAKLIQNINSALARLTLTQAQLRVMERAPWGKMVLHTHDDTALAVPLERAEEAKAIMIEEITRPPVWLPNIPLACECQIRKDYAK